MWFNYAMDFNSYFPGAGQTFQFSVISLVLIGIMVLFAIIFAFKGFLKALFTVLIAVGSFVLATMFCNKLAGFIYSTPAGNAISTPIYNFLNGLNEGALNKMVTPDTAATEIPAAIQQLGIPEFLAPIIGSFTGRVLTIPEEGEILSKILATDITMYSLVALSFTLIATVSAIVFRILLALLLKAQKALKIVWVDKIFGGLLGFVIGLAISAVISYFLIFAIAMDNDIAHQISDMISYTDNSVYTIEKGLMAFMNDIVSMVIPH